MTNQLNQLINEERENDSDEDNDIVVVVFKETMVLNPKTKKKIYLEKMVMKWAWPFINGDYFVKIIFRHHNEHAFRGRVWWVCYQVRNRAVAPMANSHSMRWEMRGSEGESDL